MEPKKFYYTDPLRVAYMAREFGVEFYTQNYDSCSGSISIRTSGGIGGSEECNTVSIESQLISSSGRVYIHPRSLPVFEPQNGDKDEDGYIYDGKKKVWFSPLIYIDWEVGKQAGLKRPEGRTARRNGKAFFMPEAEADATEEAEHTSR